MANEPVFSLGSAANPTTAAIVAIATGTTIKTLLQVATPSTTELRIVAWGISFDAAAATAIKVELLQTDVAATVTSVTPTPWSNPLGPASLCVGGAALTGVNASAEGTITATRVLDEQMVTSAYAYEFSQGREPAIPISKFLRIRVTAAITTNAFCFIRWAE